MNTNDDCNSSQEICTSQRIRQDGLIILKTRHTHNCVYSPKTPYNQRKPKSAKGSKGLSPQQEEHIELAVHHLATKYSCKNLTWLVLKFTHSASNQALINLLSNFKSFDKSIKYSLDKLYDNYAVKPFILIYGLQKLTSYDREIPCLEINILCATKDKYNQPIINEQTLIKYIYDAASKQAKETIKQPSDCYCHPPDNTLENYKQLASYLKLQVDSKLLYKFQNSDYASVLPRTWVHLPASLKRSFTEIKTTFLNSTASQHRELLQSKFSDQVTIKDKAQTDSKCIAQLNQNESVNDFASSYSQAYSASNQPSNNPPQIVLPKLWLPEKGIIKPRSYEVKTPVSCINTVTKLKELRKLLIKKRRIYLTNKDLLRTENISDYGLLHVKAVLTKIDQQPWNQKISRI